jgi:hypothetical protein
VSGPNVTAALAAATPAKISPYWSVTAITPPAAPITATAAGTSGPAFTAASISQAAPASARAASAAIPACRGSPLTVTHSDTPRPARNTAARARGSGIRPLSPIPGWSGVGLSLAAMVIEVYYPGSVGCRGGVVARSVSAPPPAAGGASE